MKKEGSTYSIKGQGLTVSDVDTGSRKVVVYLSSFDVIDSDNDMILQGAFKKSIEERGPNSISNRKIAFLRHHSWTMPIGKWLEMGEDSKGLRAIGQLGTSTAGEDALRDYEEGIIREHSIGFQYIPDRIKWIEDATKEAGGYYLIQEVKLWEGSAVTFGANEYTDVVSVSKGADRMAKAKEISDEIDRITGAIVNGKGTDERLYELEMRLKYLNSRMYELATAEPIRLDHSAESPNTTEFDWSKVYNSLI